MRLYRTGMVTYGKPDLIPGGMAAVAVNNPEVAFANWSVD